MGLPVATQMKYWGIATAVFFVVLWVLGDVIMPFLVGAAIAYFLDPIADRLESLGLSRALSVVLISVVGLLVFIALVLVVVPTLTNQATALVESAPELSRKLQHFVNTQFPDIANAESVLRQSLTAIGDTIKERGGQMLETLLGSVSSLISVAVLFVIVPVVTVYMLYDWDRMVGRIDDLLPREHAPVIRYLAKEIDRTMSGFIRGMGTVCLILGTYYAVALMLAGLQFGLVVGFAAGILTFIPYVGALVGGILAIGLALFQFWGDWLSIGLVAGIFVLGQTIEGNILTPKLVGSSIGLHPVWLIFALSVFGALFGFVGMLVAVPVAAAIGVLTRFAIGRYKESQLYRGSHSEGAARSEIPDQDSH
jgi:predicted PurR-regulated permease PerM